MSPPSNFIISGPDYIITASIFKNKYNAKIVIVLNAI